LGEILIALIVALPLLAGALLVLAPGLGPRLLTTLSAAVPSIGFFALLLIPGEHQVSLSWVPSLDLPLAFSVDGLARLFSLTVSGIGALIFVFAGAYMADDPRRARFIGTLLIFSGAMQGLVLAGNSLSLFAFWELTSILSFVLIGFEGTAQSARRAATQALVVTGLGGLGLLALAILGHMETGSWALDTLPAVPGLALVALIAIASKSAQVPLHFWLPLAMEAPTPVSAYLHSATMVQAGVYLALRLSPVFEGVPVWHGALLLLGGITLVWGALNALRVRDLKQLLAQTTLAALGLTLLLVGIGTELALKAALQFFLAHALYKAALFMVAGTIDHATHSRDLDHLSGLARPLPLSFLAALLAGASLIGLPPLFGFAAKETMLTAADGLALGVMVLGTALMAGAGLIFALRPFFGPAPVGPLNPPSPGLTLPPLVLGLLGLWFGLSAPNLESALAAVHGPGGHAGPHVFSLTDPAFLISLGVWAGAYGVALLAPRLRAHPARLRADRVFDHLYFGLLGAAGSLTRLTQHGRLSRYMVGFILLIGLAASVPFLLGAPWPSLEPLALVPHELLLMALAATGVVSVVLARTRLLAILALGVQGLMVALLYLAFGAPDLAFTQAMVEILSVVILALVMTRLRLDTRDQRPRADVLGHAFVALFAATALTLLLLSLLTHPLSLVLPDFFNAESVLAAHGRNVVNVILVDFRALDTLGEIAVVLTAGIAVLTLLSKKTAP
jgi:multicomponent Na+:H+ antiporter subunit A